MNLFQDTENRLEAFSPARRIGVTIGTAMTILAIGWYGWIAPMTEEIEAERVACEDLERKIAGIDLRRIGRTLEKMEKERLALREKVEEAEAAKRYLRSRAKRLDFIWFDQKSFLEILDRVLKRSVELGLRIDLIESSDGQGKITPMVEKRRTVRIEGGGKFADIVKLVHYIESFNALLKVENLDISLDEKGETRFRLQLVSYGVTL